MKGRVMLAVISIAFLMLMTTMPMLGEGNMPLPAPVGASASLAGDSINLTWNAPSTSAGMINQTGCDSSFVMMSAINGSFTLVYPTIMINLKGGGNNIAFSEWIAKHSDVAMASRKITVSEAQNASLVGLNVTEIKVAVESSAVIVHPGTGITELTADQLKALYNGSVVNWKDVGGNDLAVQPFMPGPGGPPYLFFNNSLMVGSVFSPSVQFVNDSLTCAGEVAGSIGGVGIIRTGYLERTSGVDIVSVRSTPDSPAISPLDYAAAYNSSYRLARNYYLYINGAPTGVLGTWVDYVLSSERGQRIAEENGFLPLTSEDLVSSRAKIDSTSAISITEYRIYRSSPGSTNRTYSTSSLGFIDSNVTAGESYTYQVSAVFASGEGSQSEPLTITLPDSGGSTSSDKPVDYTVPIILFVGLGAVIGTGAILFFRRKAGP